MIIIGLNFTKNNNFPLEDTTNAVFYVETLKGKMIAVRMSSHNSYNHVDQEYIKDENGKVVREVELVFNWVEDNTRIQFTHVPKKKLDFPHVHNVLWEYEYDSIEDSYMRNPFHQIDNEFIKFSTKKGISAVNMAFFEEMKMDFVWRERKVCFLIGNKKEVREFTRSICKTKSIYDGFTSGPLRLRKRRVPMIHDDFSNYDFIIIGKRPVHFYLSRAIFAKHTVVRID